ncbi:MAG: Nif3-like dinuclear metal center hexameric protein [Sedimentisphaeraceae bacterium JB056]
MKVSELIEIVDCIAPFELAQSWDNVGLLIGDADCDVSGCMFAVDVTESVVDEAIKAGCNTIIGYHPVVWDALKRITKQGPRPVVYKLLANGINVISVHTALDAADGGVNDALAQAVGFVEAQPLSDYVSLSTEDMYKLIVFVPSENINQVSEAVFAAGAGNLGNYSNCGFTSSGQGSFMPLEGSNPAVGTQNKLERVEEQRFETIVRASCLEKVVEAMKKAHPYEMPAYDIIKLDLLKKRMGIGRYGKLSQKRAVADIVADIKETTGVKTIGFVGSEKEYVLSGAVCAGSCGSILNKVIANECDIYITGELKHHDALVVREAGILCLCLGHSFSERFILEKLKKQIKETCSNMITLLSETDRDPFDWRSV